jgi:exopolysaccharide biosynthesis predicted pyruvyltransferase EpsI
MVIQVKRKLINKYLTIINRLYEILETIALYKKIEKNKSLKTIYLFSNPTHSNLGDQAQTFCILKWMHENYPSYKIICAPKKITPTKTLQLMHDRIKPEDLLFVHSGYLLFDPHPELPYICEIVNLFKEKRIVILPQTINLISQDTIKKVQETFNKHSNLTILCRDNVSYTNAQKIFYNCKLILWPDFVTSLIGTKSYKTKRNGILFCLRNDNEKYYSDEELNNLKQKLNGNVINRYDTTILNSAYAWKFSRKKLIQYALDKFSKYQLIITDRYHGTIFSQIASTPVIVLASTDHKLKSGVEWFPKEFFKENVFFAESLDQAYQIANEILKREGVIIENRSFFKDEYFSKLRTILDSQH